MPAGKEYVNHPPHYNKGETECIDYIEDQGLGFHLGNVVKYIARAGAKETTAELEDLKKARWYLDRYITKYDHSRAKKDLSWEKDGYVKT